MANTVKPIEILEVTMMSKNSIQRIKKSGIEDVDTLYDKIMTAAYSEKYDQITDLEKLIGIETGHLLTFAEMIERRFVSKQMLDKYDSNGLTLRNLERDLKGLELGKNYLDKD